MLDSLLIPLDGSEFSEHTLPYARAVAKASGARVHLAHVHVPHPPEDLLLNPQFQFEGVDMGEYDQEYRSEEKDYLKGVAKRFQDQTGVEVVEELLEGDVLESIQSYADRASTDLILMSTHGRTGLSRFWLGSVADDLVRNLTLPILLVPPGESGATIRRLAPFAESYEPVDGKAAAYVCRDFTCGPPIMIRFVLVSLANMKYDPEQIITTLEMKMKCGLGKCGRCNIGPAYVCKHGPVFSFADLKGLPDEY